jgi:hypothetical protein
VVQRSRFTFVREAQIWYSCSPEQRPISNELEDVVVLSDYVYQDPGTSRSERSGDGEGVISWNTSAEIRLTVALTFAARQPSPEQIARECFAVYHVH